VDMETTYALLDLERGVEADPAEVRAIQNLQPFDPRRREDREHGTAGGTGEKPDLDDHRRLACQGGRPRAFSHLDGL